MAGPRILLAGGGTGGHLYPALNLAEALERTEPGVELYFLGSQRGIEARVLPGTGRPFRLLPLQPLYRQRPWRNWRLLTSAPAVLGGVARTFRRFRPALVLGTGGYVAGPALGWARLTGVPRALQEQNAEPGLVTRLLAPRVDQVHLGYPEAEERLRVGSGTAVYAFGNPVALDGDVREAYPWPEGPTLLVVGGSQGARGLNLALLGDLEGVAAASEGWPEALHMVWVAGADHAGSVSSRVAELPWAHRIRVVPFIEDLGRQLDRVSLALSRSGAMLVAELCAAGRPAVFVPFPAAAGGHQTANARALQEAGAAEVREERDLAPGELWGLCRSLLEDRERLARMSEAARARGRPDAARRIAERLLELAAGGSR